MTVFSGGGIRPSLVKGCDRIAALTPCKQNILRNFRHTSIGHMFMLDQGCGLEATPNRGRREANISASELNGNTRGSGKKGLYFVAELYSSVRQLIVNTELTTIKITVVINWK